MCVNSIIESVNGIDNLFSYNSVVAVPIHSDFIGTIANRDFGSAMGQSRVCYKTKLSVVGVVPGGFAASFGVVVARVIVAVTIPEGVTVTQSVSVITRC